MSARRQLPLGSELSLAVRRRNESSETASEHWVKSSVIENEEQHHPKASPGNDVAGSSNRIFQPTRKPRKPRKSSGRRWYVLQQVHRFVQQFNWFPSAPELTAAMGRGSRWTTWRDLRVLERYGFVKRWRGRWAISKRGWDRLGVSPIIPRYDRKPRKTGGERLLEKLLQNQRLLERTVRTFNNQRYASRESLPIEES
jgi:hypothetical protein